MSKKQSGASFINTSKKKEIKVVSAERENTFRQLFEQMPNIAMQGYDKDRNIIFWNMASEELYGYSKQEALGAKLEKLIIPAEMVSQVIKSIEQWLAESLLIPSHEIELQHKNGSMVPVLSSHIMINNSQGEPEMFCVDIDLSERRKAQAEIERLAYFDVITNLPNRRLFLDRLNEGIAVAERYSSSIAVLYMDLDKFKVINDSFGHAVGDLLLKEIGARINAQIRSEDTVSRFGGDEFVVLLKELSSISGAAVNQAQLVAEKIQSAVSCPIKIDQHEVSVTLSTGISLFSAENHTADDLLKQADTAMFRAKKAGHNNIRFYEATMQEAADTQLLLEKDLHLALLRGEFFLLYQPQVNLTGKMIGVEALLRWKHPQRGIVLPDEFMAVAEDAKLILQIEAWVLMTACQQLKHWEHLYQDTEFQVSINVSSSQFRMTNFVSQIQDILEERSVDPQRLRLEITEGVVNENIKDTDKKMHALKKIGIRFSIDNFGTGYSSLHHLKTLPLDQLKIDQSFVSDLFQNSNDEAVIETIISMAHSLGMGVIAEGVEKNEQLQFLSEKGCEIFQGFHFDKPLHPEVVAERFTYH